jgi:hypothetical protein
MPATNRKRVIEGEIAAREANPVGRPPIELDTRKIELMASFGCTDGEIASGLGCSVDTLTRNFAEHLEIGRNQGKRSLRGKQFELAMKGNPALLIWLGKNWLGQSDKIDYTHVSDEDLIADAEAAGLIIRNAAAGSSKES